jgi:predicted transcriptional regulator
MVFKDNASITRMIQLMVKECLNRTIHKEDRRKFQITEKAKELLELIKLD